MLKEERQGEAELKRLVGRSVRIAYHDAGGEVLVKVGQVVSVGGNFLEFKTRHNTYLVRPEAIVSLKVMEGAGGRG